jgi:hypothetical protein
MRFETGCVRLSQSAFALRAAAGARAHRFNGAGVHQRRQRLMTNLFIEII